MPIIYDLFVDKIWWHLMSVQDSLDSFIGSVKVRDIINI